MTESRARAQRQDRSSDGPAPGEGQHHGRGHRKTAPTNRRSRSPCLSRRTTDVPNEDALSQPLPVYR